MSRFVSSLHKPASMPVFRGVHTWLLRFYLGTGLNVMEGTGSEGSHSFSGEHK